MAYPSIAPPRERDLVLMEIFASLDLGRETVRRLNRCKVSLESIFLSDITTADGRYLEDFVFNPGDRGRSSSFKFPREVPTRDDWDIALIKLTVPIMFSEFISPVCLPGGRVPLICLTIRYLLRRVVSNAIC